MYIHLALVCVVFSQKICLNCFHANVFRARIYKNSKNFRANTNFGKRKCYSSDKDKNSFVYIIYLQLQYRAGLVTIFEHLLFEFSKKNCIPGKRNYWHGVFTKDLPPDLLPCELFRASLRAPKYIIFGKRKCYNIKLG